MTACPSGRPFDRRIFNDADLRTCSYKALGANATDENGSLDNVEFINVAKDDVLAWPRRVRRDYPSTVYSRMESTIVPFVRKSLAINRTFLDVFNARLGLPEGALASRHSVEEYSGSEARCIRSPPKPKDAFPTAIGAHSDFGSLVRPGFLDRPSCPFVVIGRPSFIIVSEDYRSWCPALTLGSM